MQSWGSDGGRRVDSRPRSATRRRIHVTRGQPLAPSPPTTPTTNQGAPRWMLGRHAGRPGKLWHWREGAGWPYSPVTGHVTLSPLALTTSFIGWPGLRGLYNTVFFLLCSIRKPHIYICHLRINTGLTKFPRRALHVSGSDARFGWCHFSDPPHFGPLTTFFGFCFDKFGLYGPKLP